MENLQDERDKLLWKQAKKRVEFRNHLYVYLIINASLWIMWFINGKNDQDGGLPWPLMSTLGWGFGLFWHFMGAYVFQNKSSSVEREFRKLKDKSQQ